MNRAKWFPGLIAGIVVALFFGLSLYLRAVLPHDSVFVGNLIKFTGTDAYYHMMLVDNLVHTLPDHSTFNPYILFPGGGGDSFSLFDYLLAGIIWLVSLGSPSQHGIDVVGVYFPAVLGALTVIPAYFIGKALFHRWAGVLAAGLIAILPGEFLGRSILGYTDHHVAEVLFSTIAMLFLILAVKAAGQGQFTFGHLRQGNWAAIIKPLVYSLCAGIFLGIYLLTWQGGLLFVFIIFVYFLIQFIIDHLRGQNNDYLCFTGVTTFFVALLLFLPSSPSPVYLASLVIAILVSVVLNVISRLMASGGIKPTYYLLVLACSGAVVLALFYIVSPTILRSMLESFTIFVPSGAFLTILEAQPILFPGGQFTFDIIWGNFTTGFLLSLISLGVLLYFMVKRTEADKTVLVVWSLIILAVTLGQRRFAYYFAVNVALLTAYVSWLVLRFAGFRETVESSKAPVKITKKFKKKRRERSSPGPGPMSMALGLVAVIFLVFYPNIGPMPQVGAWPAGTKLSVDIASQPAFAPSNAWCEALSWMKDTTQDPFDDADFYYKLHKAPFTYPQSAYGVAAWWDYGYLIARIGHRLPNSNPGQANADTVAKLFIAQDEAMAAKVMNDVGFRSKYMVVDYDTATVKFHALPAWAGSKAEDFYEAYYKRENGQLMYRYYFYPEYYRSLAVRLYNFDGQAVIPYEATVISYQDRIDQNGEFYKEVVDERSFDSYEEANVYVVSQKSGNHRIVGTDPFISPVMLSALKSYKLVYSAKEAIRLPNGKGMSGVKIFEYMGGNY